MTDFLENLLNGMSSAFNSNPTPADGIDIHFSEDKTLKWRGLHNNQYARKNTRRNHEESVKVENTQIHHHESNLSTNTSSENNSLMETQETVANVNLRKDNERTKKSSPQTTTRNHSRIGNPLALRLRRNRLEDLSKDEIEKKIDFESKGATDKPQLANKRRGRSRKVNDNGSNVMESQEDASRSDSSSQAKNVITRKLRSSEKSSNQIEMKSENNDLNGKPKEKDPPTKSAISSENKQNEILEISSNEKRIRRSIRLETKIEPYDNNASNKISPNSIGGDRKLKDNSTQKSLNKRDLTENPIDIETSSQVLIDSPKRRGRRNNKASSQEKQINLNEEIKKPLAVNEGINIGGEQNSCSSATATPVAIVQNQCSKNRIIEKQPTPVVIQTQRPLRRIKPTAKILENEELRYEYETKNIARITACNSDLNFPEVETSIKCHKEASIKLNNQDLINTHLSQMVPPSSSSLQQLQQSYPRKRSAAISNVNNNLNVDNIYPKLIQKPCPDPETFLSEIKAAKLNLHRSPEDKKLNRKQQRKLLRQKEKHMEKLGLKRNGKSDPADSIESLSDSEEFIPSKKINVGKPNVTLRFRINRKNCNNSDARKDHSSISDHQFCTNMKLSSSKVASTNKTNISNSPEEENVTFLCLCRKPSQYFAPKSLNTSFCCAADSIDEQTVGCSNELQGEFLNLLRPSTRVGYMILCDDHKKRLKIHNCCAGCGIFCTQGKFVLCPHKHFFHQNCAQKFILNTPYDPLVEKDYPSPTLVLKCPHCGLDTPEKTSTIIMRTETVPVFSPTQQGSLTKSARMSVPESQQPVMRTRFPPLIDLDRLIPESVVNIVNREIRNDASDFTSKDMFYSIKNDDIERVAEIISSGYDVSCPMREFFNGTCLHLAALFGTVQMTYLILCRDSSEQFLNMIDKELRTAIMCSVMGGKEDILKLLIQCGADLAIKGPDGMTCLHIAAKLGLVQATQYIIEGFKNSANITNFKSFLNAVDDGGWTAMVWAAENGHTEMVSQLLMHGADPNICDSENNTVLHWATLSDRVETILAILRTNVDCSVQNINGDTPLHIACRQLSTRVCLILIANGADLMVKNKAGELPYDCIRDEESQCARAVGFNMQMRTFGATGLTNRIVCGDISNGREAHPIQVVKCEGKNQTNLDDDVIVPDFKYITKSIILQNPVQIDQRVSQMRICSCNNGCNTDQCQCSTISVQNWYTPEGRLNGEFNFNDPAMIFECNDVCGCNKLICKNRVVQYGIKLPLQVFECEDSIKGWGVRCLIHIPKGSFIAEYTGEILTDSEADRRTDDAYFFDLGASDHCIDANYYGNVSRFFNHSCESNIVPVRVYYEHQDYRFPKIAFFSNQDIAAGEELAFDYGDKFWSIKQKYFGCKCRKSSCRYNDILPETSETIT